MPEGPARRARRAERGPSRLPVIWGAMMAQRKLFVSAKVGMIASFIYPFLWSGDFPTVEFISADYRRIKNIIPRAYDCNRQMFPSSVQMRAGRALVQRWKILRHRQIVDCVAANQFRFETVCRVGRRPQQGVPCTYWSLDSCTPRHSKLLQLCHHTNNRPSP